jgi:hypothetical protein
VKERPSRRLAAELQRFDLDEVQRFLYTPEV